MVELDLMGKLRVIFTHKLRPVTDLDLINDAVFELELLSNESNYIEDEKDLATHGKSLSFPNTT